MVSQVVRPPLDPRTEHKAEGESAPPAEGKPDAPGLMVAAGDQAHEDRSQRQKLQDERRAQQPHLPRDHFGFVSRVHFRFPLARATLLCTPATDSEASESG